LTSKATELCHKDKASMTVGFSAQGDSIRDDQQHPTNSDSSRPFRTSRKEKRSRPNERRLHKTSSERQTALEPGVGVEPTYCGSAGRRLNRSAFGGQVACDQFACDQPRLFPRQAKLRFSPYKSIEHRMKGGVLVCFE
jgi:hypothetical protein